MNQDRGHVDKLRRDIHIQFAQLLHITQVLGSDLRNRNVVDVNVLLADEVEQQVQRALVYISNGHRKGVVGLLFFRLLCRRRNGSSRAACRINSYLFTHPVTDPFTGASYPSAMFIAPRTSSMVSAATLRARAEPSSRISQARRGFSSYFFRLSCIGLRMLTSDDAAHPLHSIHPIPAERQPAFTLAMVS